MNDKGILREIFEVMTEKKIDKESYIMGYLAASKLHCDHYSFTSGVFQKEAHEAYKFITVCESPIEGEINENRN